MTKIPHSKMRAALFNMWSFVDQKWSHGLERDRMLVRLQEVCETFDSTSRMWVEKNKTKRMKKALGLLNKAASLEKRWITARSKKAWGNLYGGSSSTPYSDMIAAQAVMPEKPNIWAFAKMLEEYIELREAEEDRPPE